MFHKEPNTDHPGVGETEKAVAEKAAAEKAAVEQAAAEKAVAEQAAAEKAVADNIYIGTHRARACRTVTNTNQTKSP